MASVDCGETSRRQASSGTGRTTSRSLISAASGARSSPAASRLRTRPAAEPPSPSGHDEPAARRPIAVAAARVSDGGTGSTSVPGYSVRRACSTWIAICRFATTSQASSPRRRTTRSSVEGQPVRQASKPRRWRGCRARTSSVARSRSGTNPAGAEMRSRTASAAEAPSYARCLAPRTSGVATLTKPYAPRMAASGCTNIPGSRKGTETSGEVTASRPCGAHGQPRGVPSSGRPSEPSTACQGAYLKWDSVDTDQPRADPRHFGAAVESQTHQPGGQRVHGGVRCDGSQEGG